MAVPKKKLSRRISKRRRTQIAMEINLMTYKKCQNCGADNHMHFICSECGFYRGKQIIDSKSMKASSA